MPEVAIPPPAGACGPVGPPGRWRQRPRTGSGVRGSGHRSPSRLQPGLRPCSACCRRPYCLSSLEMLTLLASASLSEKCEHHRLSRRLARTGGGGRRCWARHQADGGSPAEWGSGARGPRPGTPGGQPAPSQWPGLACSVCVCVGGRGAVCGVSHFVPES